MKTTKSAQEHNLLLDGTPCTLRRRRSNRLSNLCARSLCGPMAALALPSHQPPPPPRKRSSPPVGHHRRALSHGDLCLRGLYPLLGRTHLHLHEHIFKFKKVRTQSNIFVTDTGCPCFKEEERTYCFPIGNGLNKHCIESRPRPRPPGPPPRPPRPRPPPRPPRPESLAATAAE